MRDEHLICHRCWPDNKEFLLEKGVAGAESYNTQRLQDRLRNFFGEEFVFHQQLGRAKPELIYSSNVKLQDVINAWALSQTIGKTEGS